MELQGLFEGMAYNEARMTAPQENFPVGGTGRDDGHFVKVFGGTAEVCRSTALVKVGRDWDNWNLVEYVELRDFSMNLATGRQA